MAIGVVSIDSGAAKAKVSALAAWAQTPIALVRNRQIRQ